MLLNIEKVVIGTREYVPDGGVKGAKAVIITEHGISFEG